MQMCPTIDRLKKKMRGRIDKPEEEITLTPVCDDVEGETV